MSTKKKADVSKADALKAVMGGAVNVDAEIPDTLGAEPSERASADEFSFSEGNHPSEGKSPSETPSRASESKSDIKAVRAKVVRECFRRNHDGTCLRGKCLSSCDYKRFCAGDDANALLSDAEMFEKSSLMFKD